MTAGTAPVIGCVARRHGSTAGYAKVYGCTCPGAREAACRADKEYRVRKLRGESLIVDATGTVRRLHALAAIGWRNVDMGAELGVTGESVFILSTRRRVNVTTARRVRAMYERLADTPGPSWRTARHAAAAGWLGPLWWDDDTIDDPSYEPPIVDVPRRRGDVDPVVVDRLVDGVPVAAVTSAERFEAFRRLVDGGATVKFASERLHLSGQTSTGYVRRLHSEGCEVAA